MNRSTHTIKPIGLLQKRPQLSTASRPPTVDQQAAFPSAIALQPDLDVSLHDRIRKVHSLQDVQ
jgi:hypothetical protein